MAEFMRSPYVHPLSQATTGMIANIGCELDAGTSQLQSNANGLNSCHNLASSIARRSIAGNVFERIRACASHHACASQRLVHVRTRTGIRVKDESFPCIQVWGAPS